MSTTRRSPAKRWFHRAMRRVFAHLPVQARFAMYRTTVDCDPDPDLRLELKVAETQQELEDCFRILHDAYVDRGCMKPDPSGMRVMIYHALPTTTTVCAKWEGRIVGTISMIREGVFGFPMQSIFDLEQVRAPAELKIELDGVERLFVFNVVEDVQAGFQAESRLDLPLNIRGEARVRLGRQEWSRSEVPVVRAKQSEGACFYGFRVDSPDETWRRCVAALESGFTGRDLLQ